MTLATSFRWIQSTALYVLILAVQGRPVQAAAAQYIQVTNNLAYLNSSQAAGVTATDVVVALYNGSDFPCFSVYLDYSLSISFATGARFGCIAPVTKIGVTSVQTPYGAMYAPLRDVAVDASLVNFVVTVKSAQSPSFDTQIGSLLAPGTAQLTFAPM